MRDRIIQAMNINELLRNSLEQVITTRLATIVTKTKAERVILALLAEEIERRNKDIVTRIEYNYSEILKKLTGRADLALTADLGRNFLEPFVLVEAKLFYTFDAVRDEEAKGKDKWDRIVESSFENDLKKLEKVPGKCAKYFVIFLVHYDRKVVPGYFKYHVSHYRVVEKRDYSTTSQLLEEAEERVKETFERWKNQSRIEPTEQDVYTLNIGTYRGTEIKLVVGMTKII